MKTVEEVIREIEAVLERVKAVSEFVPEKVVVREEGETAKVYYGNRGLFEITSRGFRRCYYAHDPALKTDQEGRLIEYTE